MGKQMKLEMIEPAQSKRIRSIVLVPKNIGSLRFCVDYRFRNTTTIENTCLLPGENDCNYCIGNDQVFKALKVYWKHWRELIKDEKWTILHLLITLVLTATLYAFLKTQSARQISARVGYHLILSLVENCLLHKDGLVFFSRKNCKYGKGTNKVVTILYQAGVTMILPRCHFLNKNECFGHILKSDSLPVSTLKFDAFNLVELATSGTQVRSYMNAGNVYGTYIKDLCRIAK